MTKNADDKLEQLKRLIEEGEQSGVAEYSYEELVSELDKENRACSNANLGIQWKIENAHAIQAYNRFVEENGVFSDGLRKF